MSPALVIGTTTACASRASSRTLADRVRETALGLGCRDVWARAAGPHVLLGLGPDEAFARVTPLASDAFGLSFRARGDVDGGVANRWDPVLLVDDLAEVVEHALVGEGALAPAVPPDAEAVDEASCDGDWIAHADDEPTSEPLASWFEEDVIAQAV